MHTQTSNKYLGIKEILLRHANEHKNLSNRFNKIKSLEALKAFFERFEPSIRYYDLTTCENEAVQKYINNQFLRG
ncbi:hypothetical protein [Helicobacter sp. 10-6591]|uniref:hypothetical protein n=1 Tax=Helicobacter sp. 10-6591 TaxID=2004998 RepID=UPI000DCC2E58|nr:hypothetical protein [Helicobacter sp. 10-6591]MCI7484335.1 hypothetical protein [Helicobacter sp.]RAX55471.1 hypothetical protein CCY97_04185 [Helicobacter sp. 10-6591]